MSETIQGTFYYDEPEEIRLSRKGVKYNTRFVRGDYTGQSLSATGSAFSIQFRNLSESALYVYYETCSGIGLVSRSEGTVVMPGMSISVTMQVGLLGTFAGWAFKVSGNPTDTHPTAPCFGQSASIVAGAGPTAAVMGNPGLDKPSTSDDLPEAHTQAPFWLILSEFD